MIKKERTVRELSGEIWAALQHRQWHDESSVLRTLDDDVVNELVEITMGVLARHVDVVIKNDTDLPVTPLLRMVQDGDGRA